MESESESLSSNEFYNTMIKLQERCKQITNY